MMTFKEINKIKKQTDSFLGSYGMNSSDIDLQEYISIFLNEMQSGLEDASSSSLKMLPTFIEYSDRIDVEKPVIALDAGGTNLRSAVVSFSKDLKPHISKMSKSDMPGLKKNVTKEEFFNIIADNISGILHLSSKIGFVFSYPIEIFPDKDGKLIKFTKEIMAPEVEGEFIGKNLLNAIGKKGYRSGQKIVLLNDTVATLLSGIAAYGQREYESYIGLVLGTGMNVCYIEKNSNIIKMGKNTAGGGQNYQLINVEAGNFSKGPTGEIDRVFDRKTLNPGTSTFEKMFSGAYLGGLATEILKTAAKNKLFSPGACRLIDAIKKLSSKEIDQYIDFPPLQGIMAASMEKFDNRDRVAIYFLFDNLIERAAVLTTIVLASLIIKSGKGYNPCNPVCIVAEGSSFYKMNNFKVRVQHYLKHVFEENFKKSNVKVRQFYEINRVDNAVMLGAAVAASTI